MKVGDTVREVDRRKELNNGKIISIYSDIEGEWTEIDYGNGYNHHVHTCDVELVPEKSDNTSVKFTTAITSHRCDKHREIWSTGGKCKSCERELSEALAKQFEAPSQSARYNIGDKVHYAGEVCEILRFVNDTTLEISYNNGTMITPTSSVTPVQSARYNEGKVQTREIDPNFILGIGEVLTKSRAKYDHFNWCKPTKLSTPYESLMRHLLAFQSGEETDKETGSHHLLHAATNLMFMYYHITNNPEESDDRFFKKNINEKK